MPPHQNPPANPKSHSQQMSAANKKNYEPLVWDQYFDELSFLDDVLKLNNIRALLLFGLDMKAFSSFASTGLGIPLKASHAWPNRSKILGL